MLSRHWRPVCFKKTLCRNSLRTGRPPSWRTCFAARLSEPRALSARRLARQGWPPASPASQARLVLAIDQMEELFTTHTDAQSREALVRLLAAFAASGFVWVIGTIRADFFHRCSEVPGFSALKDGLGKL